MNKLINQIKLHRDIKDSTIKSYSSYLNKLSNIITGKPFRSRQFLLKKKDEILEFLNDDTKVKSASDRRGYLAAILVAIAPEKSIPANKNFAKVYKLYNKLIKDVNNEYSKSIEDNTKTEKDKENWKSWDQILAIKNENNLKTKVLFESTKNIAKHCDRQQVLQNAIISVYTLLPPRRLEYAEAILYSKSGYDSMLKKNDTQNLDNSVYCVLGLKKGFFHYGKNTTKSKTSKNVVIDIPNELLNILKKYVKVFDLRVGSYLFQTLRGRKFSKNLFGKELRKMDVSVNILRKSYLSNKYGSGIEDQLQDAMMMNHSKGVQQSVYVKV